MREGRSRDTTRLTAVVRKVLEDKDRLDRLHAEIAFLTQHADEVLSRWAAVMLNVDAYAEVMDRHVELAGDIAWLGAFSMAPTRPTTFEDSGGLVVARRRKSRAGETEAGSPTGSS